MATTLATVAAEFLHRPGLARSTLRSYELALIPLMKEYGQMPIEILTRQALQEYLDTLTDLAYTTHHRHQSIIQALFNFAVEQGYIKANPIARLKRRKPDREKGEHGTDEVIRYLTPEQLATLYKVVAVDVHANQLETADQLLERIQQERENRYQQQLNEWEEAVKAWEELNCGLGLD